MHSDIISIISLEEKFPEIFTCITGFNNSIITGDSVLGISLDRYLGADCEYYPGLEYTIISQPG